MLRPQLLRRSRRIPRRLARSSKGRCRCGAQVPSVSRELETATTAVVGRPLRISEVLVTSSSGPNNASQATHRARLGLLWRLLSDRGSDFWARLTGGEVSRSCQVKKSVKRQCLYKPIALMPRALQNSHLFPKDEFRIESLKLPFGSSVCSMCSRVECSAYIKAVKGGGCRIRKDRCHFGQPMTRRPYSDRMGGVQCCQVAPRDIPSSSG